MGIKTAVIVLSVLLAGCQQGHCRRQIDAPAEAQPLPATGSDKDANPSESDRVFVYKYDGSLQCGQGKPIPLDVMAKQLAGIPVSSSMKKNDGLMHIQVCGSISGKANVYEIPTKFQKQAESKGFKKWTFE